MSTAACAGLALAVSAAALVRLALRDPKRLRSLRRRTLHERRSLRRLLAALCLSPGAALGLLGEWPAFLIWLGSLAAGGWLVVQALARVQQTRHGAPADLGRARPRRRPTADSSSRRGRVRYFSTNARSMT